LLPEQVTLIQGDRVAELMSAGNFDSPDEAEVVDGARTDRGDPDLVQFHTLVRG